MHGIRWRDPARWRYHPPGTYHNPRPGGIHVASTTLLTRAPLPPATDEPPAPRLVRLGDLAAEWRADAESAHLARKSQTPRGPTSGLPTLDREFGGHFPPGPHIVHGNTGSGKTALALQIAASCGAPALYVSCEMGALELARRVTARITETFLDRLRTGELRPDDSLKLFERACAAAPGLVLVDATTAFPTRAWLRTVAESVRGDAQHLLFVVDSLHSWADAAPVAPSEHESVNAAVEGLRSLSAELRAPILALAERNRASMGGGLNAGAGSRKIEYRGESVWDL